MSEQQFPGSQPLVVFLVPVAPRRAKRRWDAACAQLRQTLESIRNSADGNFCCVAAGNEPPDFDVRLDARFDFISLPLSPPAHPSPVISAVLDKMVKLTAAWAHAKAKWNPRYVMKLDADDFISSRLVGWLAQNEGAAGYLISHGWLWETGARFFIQRTETLDRVCGSCLVARSDLVERTGPFLTETEGVVLSAENARFAIADQHSLVPGSATGTLLANDSHQRWPAQFAYLGHTLASVPFPAVLYRTANPDSVSGVKKNYRSLRMFAGALRRKRLITPSLRREFLLAGG
jgi:hypothetical protein